MPDRGYLPTSYGQGGHWSLQNNLGQFFSIALISPPQLQVSLLLKTPQTLAVRHREIKLKPTRTLLAEWLAFILPKGAMQIDRSEKTSVILPSIGPYNTNLTGNMCPWLLGDKQLLSSRNGILLHGRSFMPGTVNLVKSPWIGWSQALR